MLIKKTVKTAQYLVAILEVHLKIEIESISFG